MIKTSNDMDRTAKDGRSFERAKSENSAGLPQSFEEAAKTVEKFALFETQKAARQKQLYFHNGKHVNGVKQRAEKIFKAIVPFLKDYLDLQTSPEGLARMKHLIDISAVAHDMVQEFMPNNEPQAPRLRKTGVSESATISKLIAYIEELNQQIRQQNPDSTAIFTNSDIQTLTEAIEATVCYFDPSDRSLYQYLLYDSDKEISLPALIVALADLGTLGIEGIEVYKQEGSLIFLEENLDVIPLLWNPETQRFVVEYDTQDKDKQQLYESLRQRLLKRARFQVNFAKRRFARFDREVESLPAEIVQALKTNVFKYLNQETLQEIEALTPTSDEATLQELIEFFELEKYIKKMQPREADDLSAR